MRVSHVLLIAFLVACESDAVGRYSSEADDVAMGAIASTWSEPGGLTLTLCEDVERSAAWTGPDDCVVDHVVRGGGLGMNHVERHDLGMGCGGCSYDVVAWVTGTVSGPGLAGDVRVSGNVWLQSARDDDPYGYPYTLDLTCDGAVQACLITGSLDSDGSIRSTLVLDPSGGERTETPYALSRVGVAVCP
jgi:hypothetical protein